VTVTPFIGVLQLDTRFPRPVGDIGNPNSFGFPIRTAIVRGVTAVAAVRGEANALLAPFVSAAQQLVDSGAVAIATSCGFLAPMQRALAAAVPVPVATSALLQVAWVLPMLAPRRRVGVLTIDADSLHTSHLAAVGAPADTPVQGLPRNGALASTVFGDRPCIDRRQVRGEVVVAARRLLARHPEVGAIVLECTNLPPYRRAIVAALGLPVFDCNTMLHFLWLAAGSVRRPDSAR